MRWLLDTHIAVWAISDRRRLARTTLDLISDIGNDVGVSIVSPWEIAVKNGLNRPVRDPFGITFDQARVVFSQAGFAIVPLELRHLSTLERLPPHHRDPFDRLIVATALADQYRLVTRDRQLGTYGDHVMLV